MTYHAIYTVLKALGIDNLTAFDWAYSKYGNDPKNGYTGKMKWNTIKKRELPIYLENKTC